MPTITRRSLGFLATSTITGAVPGISPAKANDGRAPDVVLFCEPTLQAVMTKVTDLWRARTGIPVRIFVARSDLLIEQIARGVRCDLVVLTGDEVVDGATRRNLITPGSRYDAWHNQLVIARYGPSERRVAVVRNSDLLGFLGGERLAVADAGLSTAGAITRAALEKLGQWAPVEGQLSGAESTAGVAFLLATQKAEFGVVYMTDVAADPALSVTATIPMDSHEETRYSVARTTSEAAPETPSLWGFLRSEEAQTAAKAGGLEPLG